MAKSSLTALVKKMQKHLKTERPRLEKTVEVGDMKEQFTLRSLTEQELESVERYSDDAKTQNKYMVYLSCQALQDAAGEMMKLETIDDPVQIIDAFNYPDVDRMAQIVGELCIQRNQITVKEVNEVKN